ncbi:hypothetical protein RND71_014697 [Anisodus tanguticus]|uniref:Cytochrome P450 n=1 Tax=Anisodus tanguticus TaxID=243964 RepID=A0AAE1VF98_9SOLA|nr:hypothetical protein RND71_014697 [Anisodus tanguticus]
MLSHGGLAHRSLASAAWTHKAKQLMAFSFGSTPVVVSSDPQIAKEILTSPHFADRPIKQSAKSLMFSRTIEFAPNGTYWRLVRRICSSHLFSPKQIATHETGRQLAFSDPSGIVGRCEALVPRVRKLVKSIIDEHRHRTAASKMVSDNADFVDVLLSHDGEKKLAEYDMVAVLWGQDTTTLLTEWMMAELVLHPEVQKNNGKGNVKSSSTGPTSIMGEAFHIRRSAQQQLGCSFSTTAMVNMWAITHDSDVWENPLEFKPERFVVSEGGANVDVRGGDFRLAQFGAGSRVCPGKKLGLVTVMLWVAKLVQTFEFMEERAHTVDLRSPEIVKLRILSLLWSCRGMFRLRVVFPARQTISGDSSPGPSALLPVNRRMCLNDQGLKIEQLILLTRSYPEESKFLPPGFETTLQVSNWILSSPPLSSR